MSEDLKLGNVLLEVCLVGVDNVGNRHFYGKDGDASVLDFWLTEEDAALYTIPDTNNGDAKNAMDEFASNFIKEWVDQPIQDGWHHLYEVVNQDLRNQAAEIKKLTKIVDHDQREVVEGLANCSVENAVYVLRKYSKTYLSDEVADNHANLIEQAFAEKDSRLAELENVLKDIKEEAGNAFPTDEMRVVYSLANDVLKGGDA